MDANKVVKMRVRGDGLDKVLCAHEVPKVGEHVKIGRAAYLVRDVDVIGDHTIVNVTLDDLKDVSAETEVLNVGEHNLYDCLKKARSVFAGFKEKWMVELAQTPDDNLSKRKLLRYFLGDLAVIDEAIQVYALKPVPFWTVGVRLPTVGVVSWPTWGDEPQIEEVRIHLLEELRHPLKLVNEAGFFWDGPFYPPDVEVEQEIREQMEEEAKEPNKFVLCVDNAAAAVDEFDYYVRTSDVAPSIFKARDALLTLVDALKALRPDVYIDDKQAEGWHSYRTQEDGSVALDWVIPHHGGCMGTREKGECENPQCSYAGGPDDTCPPEEKP